LIWLICFDMFGVGGYLLNSELGTQRQPYQIATRNMSTFQT